MQIIEIDVAGLERISALVDPLDEELHKLEQPAACPETLPLVAVDLIESIPNIDRSPIR